jgi:hypothetical protein
MGTNAEALKIRVAVPEEADAISGLAIGSKKNWNYTPEQILVFRGELTLSPEDLVSSHAHVYFDDRVTWMWTDDELPRLDGKTGLEPI